MGDERADRVEQAVEALRSDLKTHANITSLLQAQLDVQSTVIGSLLSVASGNYVLCTAIEQGLELLYANALQTNRNPFYERQLDIELRAVRSTLAGGRLGDAVH